MQVAVGYRQRNDGFGLLPNNDLRDFESHNRSVPVRLAEHGEAEGDKVLVGERGVDSIRHIGSSILWSHEKRAAVARRPAVNTVCISPVWER